MLWHVYAVSDVDSAYSESDLVCMTNQGKLFVFSLPQLRRQLCTDAVISPDITRLEHVMCSLQGSYYFAEFIFPDFSRQNE